MEHCPLARSPVSRSCAAMYVKKEAKAERTNAHCMHASSFLPLFSSAQLSLLMPQESSLWLIECRAETGGGGDGKGAVGSFVAVVRPRRRSLLRRGRDCSERWRRRRRRRQHRRRRRRRERGKEGEGGRRQEGRKCEGERGDGGRTRKERCHDVARSPQVPPLTFNDASPGGTLAHSYGIEFSMRDSSK